MNIRQSFNRALLGAVCGALLLVSPASAAEKKIVMRYSHSSSAMVKEPHHAAALDFKNYVEKATNGRWTSRFTPAASLAARSGAFRTCSRGSFRSTVARGEQRDGVQPLNGRVRPAVHVHQRHEDCYKLHRPELGSRSTSAWIAESGTIAVALASSQGFRVHHQQQAARMPMPWPTSSAGQDPRAPNNPIMIAACTAPGAANPAPMAVGRNLQRPPAEGRRRTGQPASPVFASNKLRGSAEVHHRNPL